MKKLLLTVLATAPVACAIAAVPAGQLWSQQVPEGIREARRLPKSYAPKATETESIDFTMAFKVNEALSFGPNYIGRDIWQAFYFSPELATLYAGGKVTSINITSGENMTTGANGVTRVTAYLMDELGEGAFRTQQGKMTYDAYHENSIQLDEPYIIEAGKGFYVGYKCMPISETDYYIAVDGVPRNTPGGCYVGIVDNGEIFWNDYSEDFGNLNIGITIESDNLPRNGASLFGTDYPAVVYPGETFDMEVYLTGAAINDVENIDMTYRIGDEEPVDVNITLPEPLAYGNYTTVVIKDVECSQVGANLPLEISITKVNGEDNIAVDATSEMPITCLGNDMGYQRRFLIEEGTGTWCQYCPAGIVVMEYLKAEYPDSFIRVAVHGGNDSMVVESTDPVLSLFETFPIMLLDRSVMFTPSLESEAMLDRYDKAWGIVPAIAEVSAIDTEIDNAKKQISVDAKVRFAVPAPNNGRYGIAYYITEDGVGPYLQQNAYSGSGQPMGGWEYEPEYVPTIYDDVARYYAGGIEGLDLLPATLEAEKEYSCRQTLSLESVTGSDFFVTAFIIDRLDGSVLNATQISVNDPSGVEGIAADGNDVAVIGSNGKIAINGVYAAASVYDMEGRKVAEFGGSDEISVAAGFYIVNVDGKAFKVIVK